MLVCDHCGEHYVNEDTGICAMPIPEDIRDEAMNGYHEWMKINGRDLCPKCYHLDEETDEYVENEK